MPTFPRILIPALALSTGAFAQTPSTWTAAVSAGFETRHIYRGVDSGMDGAIT